MQINASVGRASKAVSLQDQVYKLTLTAQTAGEMRWLAGLLKAVEEVNSWDTRLRTAIPELSIVSAGKHL